MRDEAHGRQVCFEFWNTINCQLCVHCQFSLLGVSLVCLYCNSAALLQWNSFESLYLCSHDRLNLTRMVPCMILLISTPPVLCTTLYSIYTYPSLTTSVELKELRLIICVHTYVYTYIQTTSRTWCEGNGFLTYIMACGWLVHWSKMFQPQTFFHCKISTICFVHICNRGKHIMSTMPHVLCFVCSNTPSPSQGMCTQLCCLGYRGFRCHDKSMRFLTVMATAPWSVFGKVGMLLTSHTSRQPSTKLHEIVLCILQCSTVLIGARGDKVTSANLHWVCPHSSQCEGWFKVRVSTLVCWRSPSLLQCVATHSQLWGLD